MDHSEKNIKRVLMIPLHMTNANEYTIQAIYTCRKQIFSVLCILNTRNSLESILTISKWERGDYGCLLQTLPEVFSITDMQSFLENEPIIENFIDEVSNE